LVSYCSRLIKASAGQSFNDWKRTLRIRKAEQLLLGTAMPIAEISTEFLVEIPDGLKTAVHCYFCHTRIIPLVFQAALRQQRNLTQNA